MPAFFDVAADSHFPLQNLPYGVFSPEGGTPRVGVALGDRVVDLAALESEGLLDAGAEGLFGSDTLNAFAAAGKPVWDRVRARLQDLLSADGDPALRDDASLQERALHDQSAVQMHLPVEVGDYTDFYASKQHATNVGTMFRGPENALMPNWLHLPVGYHGRASSVVVSGTPVVRPSGQQKPSDDEPPVFGASRLLDFELELGVIVGLGNDLGTSIPVDEAGDHIFGYVLVNDWSARDIQKWEYVPLGPFLGKNFATSVSPWVVPYAALAPFRVEGEPQSPEAGNPEPLPYLRQSSPRGLDLHLEVRLASEAMRGAGEEPAVISTSNAKYLYWSAEQQLAHHTVNGCNARPGDLLASGTISGETPDAYGSMLELTWRGTKPLELPDGSERKFLADGDEVVMTGWGERNGVRIGFGEVRGVVQPARA